MAWLKVSSLSTSQCIIYVRMIMLTHFPLLQHEILSSNVPFACSCSYPILPVLQALSLCINGMSSIPRIQKICGSSLIDTVVDFYFFPEDLRPCVSIIGKEKLPVSPYSGLFLKSSKYLWYKSCVFISFYLFQSQDPQRDIHHPQLGLFLFICFYHCTKHNAPIAAGDK